jgi:hypothetical protein
VEYVVVGDAWIVALNVHLYDELGTQVLFGMKPDGSFTNSSKEKMRKRYWLKKSVQDS